MSFIRPNPVAPVGDVDQSALDADWTARSTAAGVVWAHDFRSDAEVNRFRFVGGYGIDNAGSDPESVEVRRITTDKITGTGCLEINVPTGGHTNSHWWRPFSPLDGTSNGRGVDDPADGGDISLKTYGAAQGDYAWTEGLYGHTDYQTADFDGTDFWIQFRCKVTSNRENGSNPDGKLIYIDIPNGSRQEIIVESKVARPLSVYSNFGHNDGFLAEPQGQYASYSSPSYSASIKQPNVGRDDCTNFDQSCSVDGPGCWCRPLDEWFTLLIHVVPGHGEANSNYTNLYNQGITTNKDSRLEIWAARADEWNYTKIHSKANYMWAYEDFFGWNMFKASAYCNNINSVAGWQHRYTQVIFSKQWIECPAPLVTTTPSWFEAMPDQTWIQVAAGSGATSLASWQRGNRLLDVKPPAGTIPGDADFTGVTDAWTGGAVDHARKSLIMPCGGGHGDYPGNEIYELVLNSESPAWARVWGPSSDADIASFTEANNGPARYGTSGPSATHNYKRPAVSSDGKVWLAGIDSQSGSSGWWSSATHSWDRDSGTWTYHGLGCPTASTSEANWKWLLGSAAYDPVENKIWSVAQYTLNANGPDGMFGVDCFTGGFIGPYNYNVTSSWACVLPGFGSNGRSLLVLYAENGLYTIDLNNPGGGMTSRTRSGSDGGANQSTAIGVYHAPSRAIFSWHNNGASVKKLSIPDPISGTWTWSTVSASGSNTITPSAPPTQGTFGKFNLIKDMGNGQSAFVLINDTTESAYVYKIPVAGL